MADRGHPLTKIVLKQFVVAIIKKNGRSSRIDLNTGPSKKWIRKSLNRHKDLKSRRRGRADKGRLQVTQEQVGGYFDFLGKTLKDFGLENSPESIYNCDETGFDGHGIVKE